eukprot:4766026-Pleurochrysis_carterae.AAC.2
MGGGVVPERLSKSFEGARFVENPTSSESQVQKFRIGAEGIRSQSQIYPDLKFKTTSCSAVGVERARGS